MNDINQISITYTSNNDISFYIKFKFTYTQQKDTR